MPETDSATSAEQTHDPSAENPVAQPDEQKSFTQEEVSRLLAGEKSKYKGFSELKEKAERYDELEQQKKTELELASERAEKAEAERDRLAAEKNVALWTQQVSKATGVPAEALRGSTKEELETHAEALAGYFKKDAAPHVSGDGSQPGIDPQSTDWLRNAINR